MGQYLTSGQKILEIEDFLRKLTYIRVDSDVDTIIDHLNQISTIDKQCEKSQKNTGIAAFCTIAISIIVACTVTGVGATVLVVGLISSIALAAAYGEHARLNVEDHRYLLAEKLLEMFKRDLSPRSLVSLEADFHGVDYPSNFARKVLGGRLFASKWLTLKGQFLDGTEFEFTVTEFLKIKHRKSKKRHKGYRLDLVLTLRDVRYARVGDVLNNLNPKKRGGTNRGSQSKWSEPLTGAFGGPHTINDLFQLPYGAKPARLEFRGKRLMLSVKLEPKLYGVTQQKTADDLYKVSVSTFLTAYHLLNFSRRISSASPKISA
jgi:hypothetical protein